jgi:hypothetical protein
MAAADLETGLRAYLLTQSAVVALAPADIHGGELHEDETPGMPQGAVVLKSSGGVDLHGGSYAEVETRRFDVFTFGRTRLEADQLMAEVALAFKRLRRGVYGGVLINSVNSAGGQSGGREPGVEWPRAWRSFQAEFALETVA